MKLTASTLSRLAGSSAMIAGSLFVIIGLAHPPDVLASVTTTRWIVVHSLATAMGFFGLLGMVGIYARQVRETGWLGFAGFVLFSLWFALTLGMTFVEAAVLPLVALEAPAFAAGFVGIFTGATGATDVGALPAIWLVMGPLYILGGLLFGIATFRAGILSRPAALVLAVGTAIAPVFGLIPHEFEPLAAVPVGFAIAWLGYALWADRRVPVAGATVDMAGFAPRPATAE